MALNEIDKLLGVTKSTRIIILWSLLIINILAITKPSPNSNACKRITYPHRTCDNYKNYFLFATCGREAGFSYAKTSNFGILGVWIMFVDDGNDYEIILPFVEYK